MRALALSSQIEVGTMLVTVVGACMYSSLTPVLECDMTQL